MSGIFISYRRDDTSGHAGRLYDRLSDRFGEDRVFIDIDTIEPGVDFFEAIQDAVGSCDALIVLIGKRWLTVTDETGQLRLDNPMDFVRLEVETALNRNIRVIPVLVQGAVMPRPQDLPESLVKLTRRNALELSDARWHYDVGRLINVLEKYLQARDSIEVKPLPIPNKAVKTEKQDAEFADGNRNSHRTLSTIREFTLSRSLILRSSFALLGLVMIFLGWYVFLVFIEKIPASQTGSGNGDIGATTSPTGTTPQALAHPSSSTNTTIPLDGTATSSDEIVRAHPTIVTNNVVLRAQGFAYGYSGSSNILAGSYGGKLPSRGQWLIVTMTVRNLGSAPAAVPDNFFVVKDAQGRVSYFDRTASSDYLDRFGGSGPGGAANLDPKEPVPRGLGIMPLLFDVSPNATDLVIFTSGNIYEAYSVQTGQ